jgi:hypothetical protein
MAETQRGSVYESPTGAAGRAHLDKRAYCVVIETRLACVQSGHTELSESAHCQRSSQAEEPMRLNHSRSTARGRVHRANGQYTPAQGSARDIDV